jgi:uncharacterized membrane protein
MEQNENEEITREEIKKEFQLERMILFSDAVFAIVITLMAIEIKIPESEAITEATLPKALIHLLPTLTAYIASFIFIGAIWYQHLKMFSLLKDYDKGLVIRNMLLLFFVGLFPFSASIITRGKGQMIPFFIYLCIILLCIIAQYILYHYIVITRPSIRLNTDMAEHKAELYKRKVSTIGFTIAAILIITTYILIPQQELKTLSMLWMMAFPIVFKIMTRKKRLEQKKF